MSTRIVLAAILVALYLAARMPRLSDVERQEMAQRFRFECSQLGDALEGETEDSVPCKQVRACHPSLAGLAGWISTVGAAIALADLDGNGRSDDIVRVDPRSDRVLVQPVPASGERYRAFELRVEGLPYDELTMAPMGCLPGDLNEDGQLDLLVYYWGRTPVLFLGSPGAPSAARFRPCELVPAASPERWFTNAGTLADCDGDGHLDVVIGNYFADGARILDASAEGREEMQRSMSRASNGGLDRLLRFVGLDGDEPRFEPFTGEFCGDRDTAWTLALGAADLDGDLLPELYFGNDFGPDVLLFNRSTPGRLAFERVLGTRDFTTPASCVLGADSFKGMGVDFGDLDGDGELDIGVSNITTEFGLQESQLFFLRRGGREEFLEGRAPFVNAGEELGLARSGWAWEVRFGDFDGDGGLEVLQATGFLAGEVNRWPELHEVAMGNDQLLADPRAWHIFEGDTDLSGHEPNPFYVRASDGRYYDLARELGLDQPQVSRGIATGDVDRDGDLDFALANQWQPARFYHNESARKNLTLGLDLRLPVEPLEAPARARGTQHFALRSALLPPSRAAIGACARVMHPDGHEMIAEVDGGNGHSGCRAPELLFGLGPCAGSVGAAPLIDVELGWRDELGRVHREKFALSPGWHTLLLGRAGEESE